MKAFIFDSVKCTGCFACQIACKDEHVGNDWSPISAPEPDIGSFWIRVDQTVHGQTPKVRVEYKPFLCNMCDNAACIEAAPDAVYRREDGLIIIDPEKAKGNKALVEACPYGSIYWNDELELPQKCTGCAHLLDEGWTVPRCVEVCATEALRFGDEEDFADEIAGAVKVTDGDAGGHVYYINLPGLFISGDVWDPVDNVIIEGATATLLDAAGAELATAQTDGFGDFWFKGLEAGDYSVRVEAKGFVSQSKDVKLDKSLNIGDFPLDRQ